MGEGNRRYYRARAKTWALGESSKGTPEVAVLCDILTEDAAERQLTWRGYFSDAAADRAIESLRIFGWQGDDLTDLVGLDSNEVELVVEDETYEGKTSARVKFVNRPGGLTVKTPLTGDKAKAFAASMRDRVRALDASNGVRKPAPKPPAKPADTRPEPPPLGDDDIPF